MLRLDVTSLVWAFFCVSNEGKSPSLLETLTNAAATSEQKRVCPEEKEDSWKYEKKIKEIRMKKSLR